MRLSSNLLPIALPNAAAPGAPTFPHRFGRRLTIAFVLVAACASGLLAVGCLSFVGGTRFSAFRQRSVDQARLAVALGGSAGPESLQQLLALARHNAGFDVVGVTARGTVASVPELSLAAVPSSVRSGGAPGSFETAQVRFHGEHFFVVAAPQSGGQQLYLFFSEQSLYGDLEALALILLVGWASVVVLATLVGRWVARQTLAPVQSAARAATDLARGLLDTRLDTAGHDEFGVLAQCFNGMAARLQSTIVGLAAARDRERAFAANAAHELRTPLSVIVASADLLQEREAAAPPDVRHTAELVAASAGRLDRLITDLLELSRMDAGVLTTDHEPIELRGALASVLTANGWEHDVELCCEETWVSSDWPRLERIVTNLTANALQHGGGRVLVAAGPVPEGAEISVSDQGPGIAEVGRIFDRFYKAPASSGTGLGLAVVRESARLLGTDVHVDTGPHGSRFRFTLPLA